MSNLSRNEISVKDMNVKIELPLSLQTIYTRNEFFSMQSKEGKRDNIGLLQKISTLTLMDDIGNPVENAQ